MLGANGMDEKLERKASLYLEGNQLALLKLENPQVGQTVSLCLEATITGINIQKNENGDAQPCVSFEVQRVEMEPEEVDPMVTIASMYPSQA